VAGTTFFSCRATDASPSRSSRQQPAGNRISPRTFFTERATALERCEPDGRARRNSGAIGTKRRWKDDGAQDDQPNARADVRRSAGGRAADARMGSDRAAAENRLRDSGRGALPALHRVSKYFLDSKARAMAGGARQKPGEGDARDGRAARRKIRAEVSAPAFR